MEQSKHYNRAKELLQESVTDSNGDICRNYNQSDIIEAMCQLAEEVEAGVKTTDLLKKLDIYTKAQVEELLQKQRELCAENAIPEIWHNSVACSAKHVKLTEHFKYVNGIAIVKHDSILNAKLIF